MTSLKSWIFFVSMLFFCTGWCETVTTPGLVNDAKVGQVGLGVLTELVSKVQQVLKKYKCAYKDPEGVCSAKTSPDCSEVKRSGVCVMNSCQELSEADKADVADFLVQIAKQSHEICGESSQQKLIEIVV
ncbi:hypothetical protein ElyMa_004289300 [Elysia marginata]|uniref:Saposin B-type domain-containing protein n=1 Tax=Elysia marginata TaxID=1093978 RepID=A0AAV4GXK9_9GAST|nr:hypothetical protein ElyMa_004289300 [Elysia marginata]